MQKHFPICKFGNKQMTQEVALAQMHCATIWELKGSMSKASPWTGQMAFYRKLSDHQLISFSRQWLLKKNNYCHFGPISTKAQCIFPVSCPQSKLWNILFPWFLLPLGDMRGEVCRWLRHIFYLYVALINSFLNIFQRLSPPERAFLIKIFSHSPIMFQEKLLPKVDQLPLLPQCPCAFKV